MTTWERRMEWPLTVVAVFLGGVRAELLVIHERLDRVLEER